MAWWTTCRPPTNEPQPLTDPEGNPNGQFAIVSPDEPFRALAFKIMDDRFGALTFCRIYSGKLDKGDTILNSATGKTERIGRMVEMMANDRIELSHAEAGDIIAIVGMKNVQTGHTLCDPKSECTLEAMVFPEPVISIAVEPKDKGSMEKMSVAIGKMVAEDPTLPRRDRPGFRRNHPQGHGRTAPRHQGGHPEAYLRRRTGRGPAAGGLPRTITREVEDSYTHKKQSGGSGQYGKIDYRIRPGEQNSGFKFVSSVVGAAFPRNSSRRREGLQADDGYRSAGRLPGTDVESS